MSLCLRAEDLTMVFDDRNGGLTALANVSFEVCPQEFVCVVGPSGSGKTTLLRLLAGLMMPTAGGVLFEGEPVRGPRRRVGMVFQRDTLLPWRTALGNVLLPLELEAVERAEADQRARELIELVGLTGFEHLLPRQLSGGMAQRVAIASALVHRPDLLLLDEPFGSLDALTRERMGAELLRIWEARKKTVVMVTHSISEALLLADRVLVLSGRPGQIRLELNVPYGRPRDAAVAYTAEFTKLAGEVKGAIE